MTADSEITQLDSVIFIFSTGLSSSVHTDTSFQQEDMLGFLHASCLFRPIFEKFKYPSYSETKSQETPDTRVQWWESVSRFFLCYLLSFIKILYSWAPPVMSLFNSSSSGHVTKSMNLIAWPVFFTVQLKMFKCFIFNFSALNVNLGVNRPSFWIL